MNVKGISPPPKPDLGFEDLRKANMGQFARFMETLDKWLQRLTDATAKINTTEITINPTTVNANTTSEQTFTVVGLAVTDIVYVNKPTHQAGLGIVGVRASDVDELAITFMNTTGSGIDPTSETYLVAAIRR